MTLPVMASNASSYEFCTHRSKRLCKSCRVRVAQRQWLCSFLPRKRHPLLLRDTIFPEKGPGLFFSSGDEGGIRVHFRMKMINKISKILSHQADFFPPNWWFCQRLLSALCSLPDAVITEFQVGIWTSMSSGSNESHTLNQAILLSFLLLLDNGNSSTTGWYKLLSLGSASLLNTAASRSERPGRDCLSQCVRCKGRDKFVPGPVGRFESWLGLELRASEFQHYLLHLSACAKREQDFLQAISPYRSSWLAQGMILLLK